MWVSVLFNFVKTANAEFGFIGKVKLINMVKINDYIRRENGIIILAENETKFRGESKAKFHSEN